MCILYINSRLKTTLLNYNINTKQLQNALKMLQFVTIKSAKQSYKCII